MKFDSNKNVKKSNIISEKEVKFKINADIGISFVTKQLYSNPIQTLVQEYLSNARDAHRMINKENIPFDVVLPTEVSPVFKIRDYGPGINEDKMENIFCVLGESEKRDSNSLTGGFGIGAKSAWSYTESFMITSYVDGKENIYVAHLNGFSGAKLELIESKETNEANGVEIQIAVENKDIFYFRKAFYRCTYFWNVRPNLLGKEKYSLYIPEVYSNKRNPVFSEDNFELVNLNTEKLDQILDVSSYSFSIYFVIDEIPYKLKDNFSDLEGYINLIGNNNTKIMKNGYALFIFVNTGEVDIAVNREEIYRNEKTVNNINESLINFKNKLKEYIQKEYDKSLDLYSKLITRKKESSFFEEHGLDDVEFSEKIGNSNVLFKIDNLCRVKIDIEKKENELDESCNYEFKLLTKSKKKSVEERTYREIQLLNKTCIIIENESKMMVKRKAKSFLEKQYDQKDVVLLNKNEPIDSYLIKNNFKLIYAKDIVLEKKEIIKTEDAGFIFKAIKLNKSYYSWSKSEKPTKEIESYFKNIVDFDLAESSRVFVSYKNWNSFLEKIGNDDGLIVFLKYLESRKITLIKVKEELEKKLIELNSINCQPVFKMIEGQFIDELSEKEKYQYIYQRIKTPIFFNKLYNEINSILDTDLINALNFNKEVKEKKVDDAVKNYPSFVKSAYKKEFDELDKLISNYNDLMGKLFERYSLFKILDLKAVDEVIDYKEIFLYINSKFSSIDRKENGK